MITGLCLGPGEQAWTLDEHGRRHPAREGLYGRRKMTALVRRSLPDATLRWTGR